MTDDYDDDNKRSKTMAGVGPRTQTPAAGTIEEAAERAAKKVKFHDAPTRVAPDGLAEKLMAIGAPPKADKPAELAATMMPLDNAVAGTIAPKAVGAAPTLDATI